MEAEAAKLQSMPFPASETDENCSPLSAIRDALALLEAIGMGDLLAALPENPEDRIRHQTGITMLGILERRLKEAVGNPVHPISGECACPEGRHCKPKFG